MKAPHRAQSWSSVLASRVLDLAMRVVPAAVLVAIGALFVAQQTVKPEHRAIKVAVLLLLVTLILRFDMVYSVYLFVLLFVFPSGVSIGSTNSVLMTVIPMIWAIRATSSKSALFRRTPIDLPIAIFLSAYLISCFNIETSAVLAQSARILWRTFTACAFFYMIVMFVDDERRLMRMGKFMCASCVVVMLTAVVEVFAPGTTLIPGWIGLHEELGKGLLAYRIEGLRVGGSFQSHGMLADFGTQLIPFMVFFTLRSRNPLEKTLWALSAGVTVIAIAATANRGATAGLALALVLAMIFFRDRIGFARLVTIILLAVAGFMVTDMILSKYTVAVSVLDRFAHTEFEGIVPDTRTLTWKPALVGSLERPFFGHGPLYETGSGLSQRFWPHNGYLFFLYTIGLFGLGGFLFVMWRVYQQSRVWRDPRVRATPVGQFLGLAQVWFLVLAFEQLRTDQQRDDIYPYIVWMCFGVVVAGARILRRAMAPPVNGTSNPAQP